jgi:hypothetical protein
MLLAIGVCLLGIAIYLHKTRSVSWSGGVVERMLRATIAEAERQHGKTCPWVILIGPSGAGKKQLMGTPIATCFAEDGNLLYSTVVHSGGVLLRVSGKLLALGAYTKYWNALLTDLRRLRPGLSLNSVVVMMPYVELVKQNFLLYRSIKRRISELQVALNLVLPMYLIVSKCHAWHGFDLLVKRLNPGSVIGWCAGAVTNGMDWVAECAKTIVRRIEELCDSVLVFESGVGHELFGCDARDPSSERYLTEALNVFCAPEQGVVIPRMRGLYLVDVQDNYKTCFCSALLEKKIFVEHTLVRVLVVEGVVQRMVRRWGILAIVCIGVLGLVISIKHCVELDSKCDALNKKFAAASNQIASLDCSIVKDKTLRSYLATEKVSEIMKIMQEIHQLGFVNLWLPSSWWFFIDLYKREHYLAVVNEIKACAMRELQEGLDRIAAIQVEQNPFYRLRNAGVINAMITLLEEVMKIDSAVQDLCSASSVSITSALRTALPALPGECVGTQAMSAPFNAKLDMQRFYRTWGLLETACCATVLTVDAIGQVQDLFAVLEIFERSPESVTRQELEKLAVALSNLIEGVEGQLDWLNDAKVGEELKELLGLMSKSGLFEPAAVRLLRQRCEQAARRLRELLLALRGPSSFPRPIFVLNKAGKLKVSKDIKRLFGGVNLILAHELLQPASSLHRVHLSNLGLCWNPEVWQEIVREVNLQQGFKAKSDGLLPPKISAGVGVSVRDEQRYRIYKHFDKMPNPEPYNAQVDWFVTISGGIKANAECAKRMINHLAVSDPQACRELCEHLLIVIRQFLSDLRKFLEHGYAYSMESLAELAKPGQSDALSAALGQARTRLLYLLKNCVEPPLLLLNWIKSVVPLADEEEEIYWAQVLKVAEMYVHKQGGSIAQLEELLVGVVAGSKDMNSALHVPRPTDPYFGRMYDQLTWQLKIRLEAQNAARCAQLYQDFVDVCESKLAGKWPFVDSPQALHKVSQQDFHEACCAFDAIAPQLRKILQDQPLPEFARAKYSRILAQFERCRLWLGHDGLRVRLRVSPLDARGKQFVRWALRADQKKYTAKWGEEVVVPWSEYEHFVLEFDIANASDVRLLSGGTRARLEMGGRWEWLQWMQKWQYSDYQAGRVLMLHIPTTVGGVVFGVSVEFLDKDGCVLEWPELPLRLESTEGL